MSRKSKKNLIECPICGQRMRVITNSHVMKKHHMTMEEFNSQYGSMIQKKNELAVNNSETVSYISDLVIKSILSDEGIETIAQKAIHQLVKDHDPKFRIALNLFAVRRIQTLSEMYDKIEEIRNVLIDPARVSSMNDANLLKLLQTLEKTFTSSLDYIKSVSVDRDKKIGALFDKSNTVINIFEKDSDAPPVPDSPRSRDRIRSFWKSLVEASSSMDNGKVIEGDVTENKNAE